MFIGSCNGLFRRLDSATGAVRWATDVRGAAPKYFFHGDVLVTADRIIAPADVDRTTGLEAGVHAFDRESGRQLWMHRRGRGVLGAVVGVGERAFLYSSIGELIALELGTGKAAWSVPLKAPAWESPGVDADRVFAGSADGTLAAFQGATGNVEWQVALGAPVNTSVRRRTNDLIVGTADGLVHRVSARDGRRLASLALDLTLRPVSAPVLTADSALVLLADEGADYRVLVAVDLALTGIKWRREAADTSSTSRVFATSSIVVLGTPHGEVEAFCASTGSPAWSHKLTNVPIRVVGGTDERLYVGTPQGSLYALEPPEACG